MINRHHFLPAAFVAMLGLGSADVSAQASDGLPQLGFSLAERGAGARIDGPLLNRAKAAFAAARQSDAAYARFLTPHAEAQLSILSDGSPRRLPFTAEMIRAASESCIGPWAFDEGRNWVQLSWVCRVDGIGPLAGLIPFRESPELSLTIWFQGDLIERIQAMEPLAIPGRRRLAMNAYESARGDR